MKFRFVRYALGFAAFAFIGACQTTAPLFIYGRTWVEDGQNKVQPDWADQPSLYRSFAIPKRALGVVRINLFIPDGKLSGPLGFEGYGDGRGFSATSDAFASRVSMELNFDTGEGRVFFNETCIEIPTSPFSTQKKCNEPHPIVDFFHVRGTNAFSAKFVETAGSGFDLYLLTSAANAFSELPGAPQEFTCAIDVGFHVFTDQGSVRAEFWAPFNAPVDTYPAAEAYWYDSLNHAPKTLIQRGADPRGPIALCDHEQYQ